MSEGKTDRVVICPKCNLINLADAQFCKECGNTLSGLKPIPGYKIIQPIEKKEAPTKVDIVLDQGMNMSTSRETMYYQGGKDRELFKKKLLWDVLVLIFSAVPMTITIVAISLEETDTLFYNISLGCMVFALVVSPFIVRKRMKISGSDEEHFGTVDDNSRFGKTRVVLTRNETMNDCLDAAGYTCMKWFSTYLYTPFYVLDIFLNLYKLIVV